MPESWITVSEAAEHTGRSDQTIRRWCRDGRIVARKSGRDWLVDSNSLPGPRRRRGVARIVSLDFRRAWDHVRQHDLKQDTWIPDCLQFADWIADSNELVAEAEASAVRSYIPDPIERIPVPKSELFNRAAALPSLRDRIVYQAAVAAFADRADALLSDGVLSARLNRGDPKFFLRKSAPLYGQFQERTREAVIDGYEYVVVADVAAYFDNIDHRLLFAQIQSLNPTEQAVQLLGSQLQSWDLGGGTGIPQGPNASRVLGNLYLVPVDVAIQNSSLDVVYLRFQDDIRIAARTRADAIRAAAILEDEMRCRRLTPAAKKSKIATGADIEALTGDPNKDAVTYLMASGAVDLPRKQLRRMLDKSLGRKRDPNWSDFRFSLWRLTQLRDSGRLKRVLDSLDLLVPGASLVAAYLLPWLHQPRAIDAVDAYLTDPDRNLSDYMAIWLLAALTEAPTLTPGLQQYVRRTFQDRNQHRELRIMAANVLTRHGNHGDRDLIERGVRSELDPMLVRGFLVALRRGQRLSRSLLTEVTRRFPELGATANYLNARDRLPSVVYAGRTVQVPR